MRPLALHRSRRNCRRRGADSNAAATASLSPAQRATQSGSSGALLRRRSPLNVGLPIDAKQVSAGPESAEVIQILERLRAGESPVAIARQTGALRERGPGRHPTRDGGAQA